MVQNALILSCCIEGCSVVPGRSVAMFFGVPSSVTGCKQSVTDWKHSVTELGTQKKHGLRSSRDDTVSSLYVMG